MNTPEIQSRIKRLNREHPPARGMEWRVNDAETGYEKSTIILHYDGVWFRQVPAEAKEEDLPQIPEELYDGHAVFSAMDEKGKKRTGPENVSDVLDAAVRLIKQRIEPKPEPDVEPDENTPWGTPVEVRHDKAAWMEAIYLGRSNGFAWAAAKGDLMPRAWVRCRLRRDGK